ncbi:MAG: peptidylprolyl isomerase [Dehalococcoidia bacterium]|nr:MAG: peptidylprolyl isomerase [Dehalococcoidia bacterium]
MSRKRKPEPRVAVARKKPPRWQREHNISRFLWIFIPLVLVVMVALVGYWAYDSYVAVWNRPIAKVNATTIDIDYYVKMLRLYSYTQRANVHQASLPWQVVQLVEENEIIRQEADRLGIIVSSEEVTAAIADIFPADGQESSDTVDITPVVQGNNTPADGFGNETSVTEGNDSATDADNHSSPVDGNGNATDVDKEIGAEYYQFLEEVRISDDEYRLIVETSLLAQKHLEYLEEKEVPVTAEQVYLHYIPVGTEAEANSTVNRANEGEDFAALAQELSIDETIKDTGGNIGWVPRGIFLELDDEAFSLEVGNVSYVSTSEGYIVLKVTDIDGDREIAKELRQVLARKEFDDWMQEQKELNVIEYIDENMIDWALAHIDWKYENINWSIE